MHILVANIQHHRLHKV